MEITKRQHSGHYQIIASPIECEMLLADLKLVPSNKRSDAADELIDELQEQGFGEEELDEEIEGLDEDEDDELDEDEDESSDQDATDP